MPPYYVTVDYQKVATWRLEATKRVDAILGEQPWTSGGHISNDEAAFSFALVTDGDKLTADETEYDLSSESGQAAFIIVIQRLIAEM